MIKVIPTPGAVWREAGEPDPHGNRYACERARLAMGHMTDDELANAVFLHGDTQPLIADVIAGKAIMPIAYLTAAKDRIRWLSRRVAGLEEALKGVRADIVDEHGLNSQSIACTVWHGNAETTVDFIDAAIRAAA